MYSVVLMMALSSGGEAAPQGFFSHGCNGGCYGGGYGGGCCGSAAVYNGCTGGTVAPAPGPKPMPAPGGKSPETVPGGKPVPTKPEASLSAPATILVSLPADAKLTVDGAPTQSTSSLRVFASPALERGSEYFYNLNAEIVRDGQTITASKRIAVRAGEETRVSIDFPVTGLAQR